MNQQRLHLILLTLLVLGGLGAAEASPFFMPEPPLTAAPFREAIQIVASSDGRHLYITSRFDEGDDSSTLTLWQLDSDGIPSFVRAFTVADLELDEPLRISSVALSEDDRFLYLLSGRFGPVTLAVYEREQDGSLRWLQSLEPPSTPSLEATRGLTLSPDGRSLYTGGEAINHFERGIDGRLTFKTTHEVSATVSSLLVAEDGNTLWTAGGLSLVTYARDTQTGSLTFLESQETLSVGGDVVASFSGGLWRLPHGSVALTGFTGNILLNTQMVVLEPDGAHRLEPVAYGWIGGFELLTLGITTDPSSGHIYVSRLGVPGNAEVLTLRRDGSERLLTVDRRVSPWRRAGGLGLGSDGSRLYSGPLDRAALGVFDTSNLEDGGLERLGSDDEPALYNPRHVVVPASGDDLYVSGYGEISHFKRKPTGLEKAGGLVLDASPDLASYGPVLLDQLLITHDGTRLIAGVADRLALARRLPGGSLEWIDQFAASIPGVAESMLLAPDGSTLYVNGSTGSVSFRLLGERSDIQQLDIQQEQIPSGRYAMTADGSTIYSARGNRTPAEVLLRLPDGFVGTVAQLDPMIRVAPSPDSRHVYALYSEGRFNDPAPLKVRVYEVGETPSDLNWIQELTTDLEDTGVSWSRLQLTVDRGGRFVYLSFPEHETIYVYRRNTADGRLELEARAAESSGAEDDASSGDEIETAEALDGLTSMALSTSGHELYVTGSGGSGGRFGVLRRPCRVDDPRNLCLGGERFRVEARWQDFDGGVGDGKVVPGTGDSAVDDSGLVWFFGENNWEILVKVLDGCNFNDHYWVFSAATTNVGYQLDVTDTITGARASYGNTLGTNAPAVTDTEALALCSVPSDSALDLPGPSGPDSPELKTDMSQLELGSGRFLVEVDWVDFEGRTGSGKVVPLGTADSGLFYFFSASNWEMLVKVLDGCNFNQRYWVLAAATTNVQYSLRVRDTVTGESRSYFNPLGRSSPAITDTAAFGGCAASPPEPRNNIAMIITTQENLHAQPDLLRALPAATDRPSSLREQRLRLAMPKQRSGRDTALSPRRRRLRP